MFALALVCACNRTPAASNQPADSSQLIKIPSADPGKIARVDVHAWKNPYLIVKPDSVALLDVENREERLMKPAELAGALAQLPASAWPYGRVVAVAVASAQAPDEKVQLLKNRALVSGTLRELQIYVNWISTT